MVSAEEGIEDEREREEWRNNSDKERAPNDEESLENTEERERKQRSEE